MLYQSDYLNYCFLFVFLSDLYLLPETYLLNPCFMFSKNLMFFFIDKMITGTYSLELVIWNIDPFARVGGIRGLVGFADILRCFDV